MRHWRQFHRGIKFLTCNANTAAFIVAPTCLFVTTTDERVGIIHLEIGQVAILETYHLLALTHIIYTRTSVHEVWTQTAAINTKATVQDIHADIA